MVTRDGLAPIAPRDLANVDVAARPDLPDLQAKTDVQNSGGDRGPLYLQLFFAEVRDRVIVSDHLDGTTDAASTLLDGPG